MYQKDQRWELVYQIPQKDGSTITKSCFPKSEEKKTENIELCKKYGYTIVSIEKLYPFSTMKNQHNFDLIDNVCFNLMHDMRNGDIKYDEAEYDRLETMRQDAEEFFCLPLPVAWLPYKKWKRAKELSELAIMHRQDKCIENGHPEWVTYCV